jgi:hypothetical protein
MLIHDDVYHWKGWGGNFRLGSGKCRLRVFDLKKARSRGLAHLKPIIVVAEDVADSPMSVRSCAGHIVTRVAIEFDIDPQRMLFVEYYPAVAYGERQERSIGERYDAVDFTWHGDKALDPRWRPLPEPTIALLKEIGKESQPVC